MEQKEIEIDGFTFPVVSVDEEIYTSINVICRALGNIDDRSQVHRINRTPNLQEGLRKFTLRISGNQLTNCIHVSKVGTWLKGIRFKQTPPDEVLRLLEYLQTDFEAHVKRIFSIPPEFRINESFDEEQVVEASVVTLPDEKLIDPQELLQQQAALTKDSSHVTINTLEEDRAFRQAALAKRTAWNTDDPVPWYLADNHIQVYLGHPNKPLELLEAQRRLQELNESTVLTSRIALALWNMSRQEQQLGENGSIPINVETILEWRGIQKHTRAAGSGSDVRFTDGYERKYREQIWQDFYYLQNCYLQGKYTQVDQSGSSHDITVDGPYARVSVIRETIKGTLWPEEKKILGFLFSPGDWIYSHPGQTLYRFAHIDRRIFQLRPSQDQYSIRIILFLIERWCEQSLTGNYDESIRMRDLLSCSMIPIDYTNFARFSERIEKALHKLYVRELIDVEARCLDPTDKSLSQWNEAWLHARWLIVPPKETVDHYQLAVRASQPQLPAPTKRRRRVSQK